LGRNTSGNRRAKGRQWLDSQIFRLRRLSKSAPNGVLAGRAATRQLALATKLPGRLEHLPIPIADVHPAGERQA
jgi:hypothetical protein